MGCWLGHLACLRADWFLPVYMPGNRFLSQDIYWGIMLPGDMYSLEESYPSNSFAKCPAALCNRTIAIEFEWAQILYTITMHWPLGKLDTRKFIRDKRVWCNKHFHCCGKHTTNRIIFLYHSLLYPADFVPFYIQYCMDYRVHSPLQQRWHEWDQKRKKSHGKNFVFVCYITERKFCTRPQWHGQPM